MDSTVKGQGYCVVSGKTKYSTKKAALNAANILGKRHEKKLYTYKCEDCKYFHLTSSSKGKIKIKEFKGMTRERLLDIIIAMPRGTRVKVLYVTDKGSSLNDVQEVVFKSEDEMDVSFKQYGDEKFCVIVPK